MIESPLDARIRDAHAAAHRARSAALSDFWEWLTGKNLPS